MQKRSTVIIIFILLAGLSLLLYPSVSNYWNSFHATRAVSYYRDAANSLSAVQDDELLSAADAYNAALAEIGQSYYLSDDDRELYVSLLDPNGTGMIGYIEIPSIDVELPIYHGTDEAVLQRAAGHLEWTSLPVGGASTHSVLSGHRGLPAARLFTDLDKLTEGDIFTVTVLNRTINYEVDQIATVEPEQVDGLKIREGEDLCTLVTCTPYGINTHRLLVRGHRVENAGGAAYISSEVMQIEPIIVLPFVALPLLLIAFVLLGRMDKKIVWGEGADIDEQDQE